MKLRTNACATPKYIIQISTVKSFNRFFKTLIVMTCSGGLLLSSTPSFLSPTRMSRFRISCKLLVRLLCTASLTSSNFRPSPSKLDAAIFLFVRNAGTKKGSGYIYIYETNENAQSVKESCINGFNLAMSCT